MHCAASRMQRIHHEGAMDITTLIVEKERKQEPLLFISCLNISPKTVVDAEYNMLIKARKYWQPSCKDL